MGGKIPSGWSKVEVRSVVERHFSGGSPRCEERQVRGGEWGLLKTTAITWDRGWDQSAHKVAPPDRWGKADEAVQRGDVLVTKAGPRHRVGVVALVDRLSLSLLVSGKMVGLRPATSRIEPRYLAGALAARPTQAFLHGRTSGMAESQVNFKNQDLLEAPLFLPPLPEQKKIAEILSSVDEAIAATQRVIDQTERVKKGLLQTLMTRGIGHTRFKQTEIGEIPEAWEVVSLRSLMSSFDSGWSPVCEKRPATSQEWAILQTSAITWRGFDPSQNKALPSELEPKPDAAVTSGDILITRKGPMDRVGVVAYVSKDHPRRMIPDTVIRIRVDGQEGIRPAFIAWTLGSGVVQRDWHGKKVGVASAQVNINRTILNNTLVPVPSVQEQDQILKTLRDVDQAIWRASRPLEALDSLKRGLMQDLLTGRVRVTT